VTGFASQVSKNLKTANADATKRFSRSPLRACRSAALQISQKEKFMNIKHLRQQKLDALAKAKGLSALADKETRSLTDTERVEFDAAMASVETLNADIARAEKLLDEERTAPAVASHSAAHTENNEEKKPWASFGEQLMAVYDVARSHGRTHDPRLKAATGAGESVDAEGGFLVNPEFGTDILQRTYEVGEISSRSFGMPMASNRLVLPAVDEDSRADGSRWGGIQSYWEYEASSYVGSKPKFKQLQLTANKLTGLCYATEELLEDASALQTYVSTVFPQEFAFKIDDAVLNGPGAGAPLGILTSAAAVVQAKDSGQATLTVSTTNILNMWSRLFGPSMKNAVWFINQSVIPQLFPLTLGSGTAVQLLYFPPGMNGNNGPWGKMLGRDVIPVEQCAALTSQGDIVLADMSQYILGQKGGLRADSSMHVAFLTGEMAFRFMLRIDGQPTWKKPLTPYKGSTTLSPFVTLAAR
jgi:HK97 family phage major capsid protein